MVKCRVVRHGGKIRAMKLFQYNARQLCALQTLVKTHQQSTIVSETIESENCQPALYQSLLEMFIQYSIPFVSIEFVYHIA